AVTAIASSPRASCAAWATTVLSMPPEKATATRPYPRTVAISRSRIAASSGSFQSLTGHLRRLLGRSSAAPELRSGHHPIVRQGRGTIKRGARSAGADADEQAVPGAGQG